MAGGKWPGKGIEPVPFSPSKPVEPPRIRVVPKNNVENLADTLEQLEQSAGNLDTFLFHFRGCESQEEKELELFRIERELAKDEDSLKAWNKMIAESAKLRLRLLQAKALERLEKFQISSNLSQSPVIAFANLVLGDMLLARNEAVKKTLMPRAIPPGGAHAAGNDDIDDDLAMLNGDEKDE
jgi:hypothetical protein